MPHVPVLCAVLSGLVLVPALALAGPLDPPAGPVTPTHKTLTEVEPRTPIGAATTPGTSFALYRITEPGSYYLTGDVTGVAGRHGIYVAAANVTIDLNGYTLEGVEGAGDGIAMTTAARNLVVRDGVITGWDEGIDGLSGSGSRYERLTIDGGSGSGIVAGNSSVITDCTVRHCFENGIFCDNHCIVTRCSARSNNGSGIVLFGAGAAIDCVASSNGDHGISAGGRSLVRGNHCILNGNDTGSAGIYVSGQFSRVEGNSLVQNGRGVEVVGTRNVIVANTAAFNSTNYAIGATNTAGPVTSDLSAAGPWANIAH